MGRILVFVLLMCSTGSDKGLVGANQLLSGSPSQRPVCFLGVAIHQSLRGACVFVCASQWWEGGRMERQIAWERKCVNAFLELDFASLTAQLMYDCKERR